MSEKEQVFDPNGVSVSNGNYFALPYETEDSRLVLLSVPWDVTTSYRNGSAKAPDAILDASGQVDLYDVELGNVYRRGIATLPVNEDILDKSLIVRRSAENVIKHLEDGGSVDDKLIQRHLKRVNEASLEVNDYVYKTSLEYLKQGKLMGLVGGDHSTPYGLIRALSESGEPFGILHIDAHADLRKAYEGFAYSHASIMYNVMHHLSGVARLVQVGVRDFCEDELEEIRNDNRITTFFDRDLALRKFNGETWTSVVETILSELPQRIYISFDVDGMDPAYCPNTGTPVPGGLSYNEAVFLLSKVVESGRRIVGFDVNEVGFSETTDWDANVGARLLYKLSCLALKSDEK